MSDFLLGQGEPVTVVAPDMGDAELTAMALCMNALRQLDANGAARVAQYIAERHPFFALDAARQA